MCHASTIKAKWKVCTGHYWVSSRPFLLQLPRCIGWIELKKPLRMKIDKHLLGPEIINSKHNPDLRKSFERNLQHQASDVRSLYIFSVLSSKISVTSRVKIQFCLMSWQWHLIWEWHRQKESLPIWCVTNDWRWLRIEHCFLPTRAGARPVSRSHDRTRPIRGQYPGHVFTLLIRGQYWVLLLLSTALHFQEDFIFPIFKPKVHV